MKNLTDKEIIEFLQSISLTLSLDVEAKYDYFHNPKAEATAQIKYKGTIIKTVSDYAYITY